MDAQRVYGKQMEFLQLMVVYSLLGLGLSTLNNLEHFASNLNTVFMGNLIQLGMSMNLIFEIFINNNFLLPSDLSTENLRFLSSEQALADLAYFITSMRRKYNLTEGN